MENIGPWLLYHCCPQPCLQLFSFVCFCCVLLLFVFCNSACLFWVGYNLDFRTTFASIANRLPYYVSCICMQTIGWVGQSTTVNKAYMLDATSAVSESYFDLVVWQYDTLFLGDDLFCISSNHPDRETTTKSGEWKRRRQQRLRDGAQWHLRARQRALWIHKSFSMMQQLSD